MKKYAYYIRVGFLFGLHAPFQAGKGSDSTYNKYGNMLTVKLYNTKRLSYPNIL